MYAGAYEHPGPKRRRRRRLNIPGLAVDCLLMLFFAFVIIKAVGAVGDLFGPEDALGIGPQQTETQDLRDITPPEILGVQDITVYQGGTVAYRRGITVVDPEPWLEVDCAQVDLTVPGRYEVVYTAADASGNVTTRKAVVTVLEKQAGFVELQTIYDTAQEVLGAIIPPESTTREQVVAIYHWARTNVQYSGHSDRADWRQTAYTVMQEKRGDCYGYFAVTKLLLEQLGIPNIDVTKVKNNSEDSEHFWSLVSIDGGEHYYHFDATPRVGEGDDFCLVTDAFLDAYSQAHKNCHNRDKSLYPATPEEDLP